MKQTYIQLKASMDTKDRKENQQQALYIQTKQECTLQSSLFFFSKLFSLSYLLTLTNVSVQKMFIQNFPSVLHPCACDDFKS